MKAAGHPLCTDKTIQDDIKVNSYSVQSTWYSVTMYQYHHRMQQRQFSICSLLRVNWSPSKQTTLLSSLVLCPGRKLSTVSCSFHSTDIDYNPTLRSSFYLYTFSLLCHQKHLLCKCKVVSFINVFQLCFFLKNYNPV